MPGTGPVAEKGMRGLVARAFSLTEDAVCVGLGVLLAFSAVALLISGGWSLWTATFRGGPLEAVIGDLGLISAARRRPAPRAPRQPPPDRDLPAPAG